MSRRLFDWQTSMCKRICHITTVHPMDDVRIFHKEVRALSEAGHDVVLIAQRLGSDTVGDVRIVPLPRPRDRARRILCTTWRAFRLACREGADAYHFHDPELIPAGLLLKTRGERVVYDVHEDLPRQILSKPWVPAIIRRPLGQAAQAVEALGARYFDLIVAATPAIGRRFPAAKTIVVQNFPITGELLSAEPTPYLERPPIVAYIGGITAIRGVREMVRAIGLVPNWLHARLVLAGNFESPKLELEVEEMAGWRSTDHTGWVPRVEIRGLLGQARIGLVLFHPHPNHVEAQPNKLFEYMSAGVPVVASDFALWREIIQDAGCGLLVNPLDPTAVAGAIEWLLTHAEQAEMMGRRGLRAVRSRYNWGEESQKLIAAYEALWP